MKVAENVEQYLKKQVLPQLAPPPYGAIEATSLSPHMPVYLLNDNLSHVQVVGKTFQYGSTPPEKAWQRAEKEYANLKLARDQFGMNEGNFQVVAPLGKNKELSALLVIEYRSGNTLDYYIRNAIRRHETEELFYNLRFLARFLVKLHGNSETAKNPSPKALCKYLKKVLQPLKANLLDAEETRQIKEIAGSWWSRAEVFEDHEVMVHGDAAPTNFLFREEKVTGLELEKMKLADRCCDLGFLAAELKHNFLTENKPARAAEPYIRHLVLEYAAGFRDLDLFKHTMRRLPLYTALGLFRIARDEKLPQTHRRRLIDEAKLCLKYRG
jgi:hypothetical protein